MLFLHLCLALWHSKVFLITSVCLYILVICVPYSLLPYIRGIFSFLYFSLCLLVSKFSVEIMVTQFSHSNYIDLCKILPSLLFNMPVLDQGSLLSFLLCLIFFEYLYT